MEVYSRMTACATREEPEEYEEWGVCVDCGETLDMSDIPDDAEKTERNYEPSLRGMPSEFYD